MGESSTGELSVGESSGHAENVAPHTEWKAIENDHALSIWLRGNIFQNLNKNILVTFVGGRFVLIRDLK